MVRSRICSLKLDHACALSAQTALKQDGLYHGAVTGQADNETIRALQKKLDQEGHSVRVDGIAGPETIRAFQEELQRRGFYHGPIDGIGGSQTRQAINTYFGRNASPHDVTATMGNALPSPGQGTAGSTLTGQELQVSRVAAQNGDRTYIMVDKVHGRVILFENGKPTMSTAALTGASLGDRIPASAFNETLAQQRPEDKVTPAGRFTVSQVNDREYGATLTLNEVHGRDWRIAIHPVYLGTPSEHRLERLHSSRDADKHVSFGCINVDPKALTQLMAHIHGQQATPVYILPNNQNLTAQFFPPPTSYAQAHRLGAPA